jgi:hypothetical protein
MQPAAKTLPRGAYSKGFFAGYAAGEGATTTKRRESAAIGGRNKTTTTGDAAAANEGTLERDETTTDKTTTSASAGGGGGFTGGRMLEWAFNIKSSSEVGLSLPGVRLFTWTAHTGCHKIEPCFDCKITW